MLKQLQDSDVQALVSKLDPQAPFGEFYLNQVFFKMQESHPDLANWITLAAAVGPEAPNWWAGYCFGVVATVVDNGDFTDAGIAQADQDKIIRLLEAAYHNNRVLFQLWRTFATGEGVMPSHKVFAACLSAYDLLVG